MKNSLVKVNLKKHEKPEVYQDMTDEELAQEYKTWNKEWKETVEEQRREDFRAKKVYYCEYNRHTNEEGQEVCYVHITTDEIEAKKIDLNYRLATIDEVEEGLGLGELENNNGEFPPTIETADGVYGWFEHEYTTTLGDEEYFCKYIWLQPNSEMEIRDLADMINRMKN